MEGKSRLLIVFVRNPAKGRVKKRLAASVGEEAALQIYQQLLEGLAAVLREVEVQQEVHYSDFIPEQDLWGGKEKRLQEGEGLGERMAGAFQKGFQEGYRQIVLIGSDLPYLSPQDLQAAFSALDKHDYVLGPAEDGGYYLIGMKSLNSKLFRNKSWGSSSVLQETLEELQNDSLFLLEERRDLDTYEDLKAFPEFRNYLISTNDKINTGDN